jgi:LmbE family N-acetylglucosaminyl deacetylase
VIFLTSGAASHRDCCGIDGATIAERRELTARRATAILGVPETSLHFLRFQDGALPRVGSPGFAASCDVLQGLLTRLDPEQVFTTGPFEVWPDHLAAEELTRYALRRSCPRAELFHYCVWFGVKRSLSGMLQADWPNAAVLDVGEPTPKKQAIRTYLDDVAPCGRPYCGQLGREFLQAVTYDQELFFYCPSDAPPHRAAACG